MVEPLKKQLRLARWAEPELLQAISLKQSMCCMQRNVTSSEHDQNVMVLIGNLPGPESLQGLPKQRTFLQSVPVSR